VPSAQTAVEPEGTTTVVLAGGDGLLLLMHPAIPRDSGSSNSAAAAIPFTPARRRLPVLASLSSRSMVVLMRDVPPLLILASP
jgi:hypothetical protein